MKKAMEKMSDIASFDMMNHGNVFKISMFLLPALLSYFSCASLDRSVESLGSSWIRTLGGPSPIQSVISIVQNVRYRLVWHEDNGNIFSNFPCSFY